MNRRTFTAYLPFFLPQPISSLLDTELISSATSVSKIDSHVHFFNPVQLTYPWLAANDSLLKPFRPADYFQDAKRNEIEKILVVEAGVSKEERIDEVTWISELAQDVPQIAGMIAQTDLGNQLEFQRDLETYQQFPLVKGVRSYLNARMLHSSQFIRNLNTLTRMGYCLELLVPHSQLSMVAEALKRTPTTRCIIAHMGNPPVQGETQLWRKGIRDLAALPNVACKLSGVLPSSKLNEATRALQPIFDHLIGNFGVDRLMFAGDWPAILKKAPYQQWIKTVDWLLGDYPKEVQRQVYQENAARIYRL
ncbi:MAG: amidohydrolase family protein [Bacteroidota bacterium]